MNDFHIKNDVLKNHQKVIQKYIQKRSKNQEKVSLGTLPGAVRNTATTAKTQGTLLALIFDRKSIISGCEINDF